MDSMKESCKCHGISGSCSIKTCWEHVPPMQMIASTLIDKYDAAVKVRLRQKRGRSPTLVRVGNRKKGGRYPKIGDLVYLEESPNYCEKDTKKGIPGTQGRVCQEDQESTSFCQSMCCDRGYKIITKTESVKCKCKFHYCCRVVCETCTKTIETAVCK